MIDLSTLYTIITIHILGGTMYLWPLLFFLLTGFLMTEVSPSSNLVNGKESNDLITPASSELNGTLKLDAGIPICRQIEYFKFPPRPALPYETRLGPFLLDFRYDYWFSWQSSRRVSVYEEKRIHGLGTRRLLPFRGRPYNGQERYHGNFQLEYNFIIEHDGDVIESEIALFATIASTASTPNETDHTGSVCSQEGDAYMK